MLSEKIEDFFHAVGLWLSGQPWKEAKHHVESVRKWVDEDRNVSRKIFGYFRILNEIPGLKIWMIDIGPFGDNLFASPILKITLENNGRYAHKTESFSSREELLNYMENEIGGLTLFAGDKSFTFPSFRTIKELKMKLTLKGLLPFGV